MEAVTGVQAQWRLAPWAEKARILNGSESGTELAVMVE
jgi:hypothetical protein